jgi:acid-sensing ion channel, other
MVMLRLKEDDMDKLCREAVQGFKVHLHLPNEAPKVSTNYYSIPLKQEVTFNVKPTMMTTSSKLKSYDPKIRQCFFEEEKKLKFFKIYTQNNCEIECLANFTLKTCGCVKFSMPHDSEAEICGQNKLECYNDAEDKLLETKMRQGLKFGSESTECNCKPSCTSIHYNAEISQTDFNALDYIEALEGSVSETKEKFVMSKIKILFKEPQFITSKRSELYGLSEFLANCGGILGSSFKKN